LRFICHRKKVPTLFLPLFFNYQLQVFQRRFFPILQIFHAREGNIRQLSKIQQNKNKLSCPFYYLQKSFFII
jgi:hypothetical protein